MRFFIPPFLWTAFITFVSLINSSSIPSNNFLDKIYADKLVHALLYAILFILYRFAFQKQGRLVNVTALSLFIAISTGIVIEMLQCLLNTGRHFEILDIMANITGVLIALFIIKNSTPKRRLQLSTKIKSKLWESQL